VCNQLGRGHPIVAEAMIRCPKPMCNDLLKPECHVADIVLSHTFDRGFTIGSATKARVSSCCLQQEDGK
jgi:hypothetical protein